MSLLTDLLNTVDTSKMGEIAGALGESHESVSQGMQSALGTVLGGIASKAGDTNLLQKLFNMAPTGAEEMAGSSLAGAITDPNSPLMSAGKGLLATLFGRFGGQVTQALGNETGLPSGSVSSLLAMAAPMVMSFLGRRAADQGMNIAGIGSLLQREAPAILSALPGGLSKVIGTFAHDSVTAMPAVAQAAAQGRPSRGWLLPLVLLALIPTIWLLSRASHKSANETPPPQTGVANRMPDADTWTPSLPGRLDLHFPGGSMQVPAVAELQLKDFASALAANPDTLVLVSAFTDNVASESVNMRLSQQRADGVKAALIRMGVPADRITATGYGEQNPIADNNTAEGREANNRVSVEVRR